MSLMKLDTPRPKALCYAEHPETGALCGLEFGHLENHRGEFRHGIAQWPRERPTPPAEPVPDTVEQAKKLHIAFNVALRRAGVGHLPACDGPDCLICRDPAVLKALAAGAQGEREALLEIARKAERDSADPRWMIEQIEARMSATPPDAPAGRE